MKALAIGGLLILLMAPVARGDDAPAQVQAPAKTFGEGCYLVDASLSLSDKWRDKRNQLALDATGNLQAFVTDRLALGPAFSVGAGSGSNQSRFFQVSLGPAVTYYFAEVGAAHVYVGETLLAAIERSFTKGYSNTEKGGTTSTSIGVHSFLTSSVAVDYRVDYSQNLKKGAVVRAVTPRIGFAIFL